MKNDSPIAVASRSFSRNSVLRVELLERYPNVLFNDDGVNLKNEELIAFARGRKKIITALEIVDESFLNALPELEVISKYGVGTDMLDKEALIRHGIRLGWKGGVNRRSVTELVIAFMISLLRHVTLNNIEIRNGIWQNRQGRQLSGRIIGIIGCGHIGKDLVPILKAFGCRVLIYDIRNYSDFYAAHKVEPVALEELLRLSDIVTLHVPLDKSTRNLLTADRLELMKSDALLINAARGGLVDEQALKRLLIEGHLAGAGFDVFRTEPPQDLELLSLPNFLATPHIGGSSEEAILEMGRAAIDGLDDNKVPSFDYPPAG